MDVVADHAIDFLTGNFPYCKEICSFLHGYLGFMGVRKAQEQTGAALGWFHTFFICLISSFGGAILTPMWLGRPSSIIATDMTLLISLAVYAIVFLSPFSAGYQIAQLFPVRLILTIGSSLFKTLGMIGFCTIAFDVLKENPAATEYYPVPIFGPIIWASMLGNMGAFFMKGFHTHLENGMPYPFQSGLFWATFFHFYVNDTEGPIGNYLRHAVDDYIPWIEMGLDHRTFAVLVTSISNQIVGILQMPEFSGPSFSPFVSVYNFFYNLTKTPSPAAKKIKKQQQKKKKQ